MKICVIVGLAVILGTAQVADAAESAPYPNGTSGILGGSVPGPGLYYLIYNFYYHASRTKDGDGRTAKAPDGTSLGFNLDVVANVHRLIHVTTYKILGAEYSWNVVVPFVRAELDIRAFGIDDSRTVVGDFNAEPFVLEWRGPRWDFGLGLGFFAPSGERDSRKPALPGKGFWTVYPIVAGTYFLDPERTWSVSILSRYEIPLSQMSDVDVTAGHNFSFEWGIGKTFETLTVGMSGYASWQVTRDLGNDADVPATRDRAFGFGPELQYFLPTYGFGFQLRHWREFFVQDRPEGHITTLTLVKPF